jgi:hypothetical protein
MFFASTGYGEMAEEIVVEARHQEKRKLPV